MDKDKAKELFGVGIQDKNMPPPFAMAFRCLMLDKSEYEFPICTYGLCDKKVPTKGGQCKKHIGKKEAKLSASDEKKKKEKGLTRTVVLDLADKGLFIYLQSRCINSRITWVAQETIAYDVNLTREWLNRKLQPLIDVGLVSIKKYQGNHNCYCLAEMREFYGEAADLEWREIDNERRATLEARKLAKVKVTDPSLSESEDPKVTDPSLSKVMDPSLPKVTDPSHKLEEGELEKVEEEKYIYTPDFSELNTRESSNTKEEASPSVGVNSEVEDDPNGWISSLAKVVGDLGGPQDAQKGLRLAATQKSKDEAKLAAALPKRKKAVKLKPGQSQEEFDHMVCSDEFHGYYIEVMREIGKQPAKWTYGDANQWQNKFFPVVGDLAKGLFVIRELLENWDQVRMNFPMEMRNFEPTVGLLCSRYVEQPIARILNRMIKPQRDSAAQAKQRAEEVTSGWDSKINRG